MLKSLYSGVSGIQTSQVRMDVIGNNIANVNTVGFKRGSVAFQELLSQTISGASAPTAERGGTNAIQVGLGVKVGSVTNQFTQGNLQYTGSNSDMAVEGNGFFVVANGQNIQYTRAGNFSLDKDGSLVHSANGMILQGWMADESGVVNANTPLSNVEIPIGRTIPANATSLIRYEQNIDSRINGDLLYLPTPMTVTDADGDAAQVTIALTPTGNFNEWDYEISVSGSGASTVSGVTNSSGTIELDSDGKVVSCGADLVVTFGSGKTITLAAPVVGAAGGGNFAVSSAGDTGSAPLAGAFTAAQSYVSYAQIYDSLGGTHQIALTFSKLADNQWSWEASSSEAGATATGSGVLNFNPENGNLLSTSGGPVEVNLGAGIGTIEISPDFSGSTQFATDYSMLPSYQDGYSSGALQSFSIDNSGGINGVFSNGIIRKMATVALANFANSAGLVKEAGSFYSESRNSGEAYIGTTGTGGRGRMLSGTLETSNVDLSQEFTDLITTQRGYQANARIITTSDELLQELLNLKR
jgi:flagellar hook protein FlgE